MVERAGYDLRPLDPSDEEDRVRLLCYIWSDEPERIAKLCTALDIAACSPVEIGRASAAEWLARRLAAPQDPGVLTVTWHSVFWQYLPEAK